MSISRRAFMKLTGLSTIGETIRHGSGHPAIFHAPQVYRYEYGGADLTGWEVDLGDAICAAEGEDPVTEDDIETIHHGTWSELQANVARRKIVAHNITFSRIVDDAALEYIHTAGYEFRLPYRPDTGNTDLNGQTLEGGVFIWDGAATRLDYGLAFQWILNPWGTGAAEFGTIRCWTDIIDGDEDRWQNVGYLEPDTSWHELRLVFDFRRQATALTDILS